MNSAVPSPPHSLVLDWQQRIHPVPSAPGCTVPHRDCSLGSAAGSTATTRVSTATPYAPAPPPRVAHPHPTPARQPRAHHHPRQIPGGRLPGRRRAPRTDPPATAAATATGRWVPHHGGGRTPSALYRNDLPPLTGGLWTGGGGCGEGRHTSGSEALAGRKNRSQSKRPRRNKCWIGIVATYDILIGCLRWCVAPDSFEWSRCAYFRVVACERVMSTNESNGERIAFPSGSHHDSRSIRDI